MTPPRMPSGTTMMKATAASFSECPSAVNTNGRTGNWNWYEVPMLPRKKPDAQVQY